MAGEWQVDSQPFFLAFLFFASADRFFAAIAKLTFRSDAPKSSGNLRTIRCDHCTSKDSAAR
jgi:hypothetical protein